MSANNRSIGEQELQKANHMNRFSMNISTSEKDITASGLEFKSEIHLRVDDK
jgi:hypothetical protein